MLLFYREDADELAGQVWAALAYVTNWFFIITEQSYFALVERPPVFQHLWSLAIEEQFYLLWPLLLLGLLRLFRSRPVPIAGVVTLGAIASLVWMAVLFEPAMDPSRAYYGTDTRASGLLLGAALALVWKPSHRFGRRAGGQDGRARPRRDGRRRRAHRVLRARCARPTRSSTAAGSPSSRSPRARRSWPPSTRAPCSASTCWPSAR